jgi:hypothetical protein
MIIGVIIVALSLLGVNATYAGEIGVGIHAGYGSIHYTEDTSSLGSRVGSESTQPVILAGLSGEHTFGNNKNLFVNLTTDWIFSREGDEKWKEEGVEIQENNLRFFGQFYDLRLGYKNAMDDLYYRFYISGGWDGLNFKRDNFVLNGIPVDGEAEEDFSLIRTGVGGGVGYRIKRWAIDGRIAYSYYPYARIKNTVLPGFEFSTHGTCLDGGAGVAYQINERLNFYAGFSYTLLRLDESDVIEKSSILAVFPESRTEIRVGMLNLTYVF